ncbi:hypothetical protein WJX74_001183 [Apatococcus lobatus]|uniref:microtubule-severing ATPase n=1 Tax=Apatococcus lobatus TaxID=904363 RepID=A0AAW1S1X3_9CHLO
MNLFGLGGRQQQHKQAQAGAGRPVQQKPPADDIERLEGYFSLAWEALEQAYNAELSQNYAFAMQRYALALQAIDGGLGLSIPSAGLGPAHSNPARHKHMLRQWKPLALERLTELRAVQPGRASTSKPARITQLVAAAMPKLFSYQPSAADLGMTSIGGSAAASRSAPAAAAVPRPSLHWRASLQQAAPQLQPPERPRLMPRSSSGGSSNSSGQPPPSRAAGKDDARLREVIQGEVLDTRPSVRWTDIAGLAVAKQALQEMVILPTLRSDLFQGLRAPARGLLLYGPPGNGKTLLAKALAHEARATFFNITAQTLTSKWHGEAEKLVRVLFAMAAEMQPSIIFIDEIDSILSERSAGEHEASRRLKTQFLVEFDGVARGSERIVVIGATNRPQELDDAVRRRLVKRVYIPLPDPATREAMLKSTLQDQPNLRLQLRKGELQQIVQATQGYSGSDLAALCREAAWVPLRELGPAISTVPADRVRPLTIADFGQALQAIKPSVNQGQLAAFEQWTRDFGTTA